VNRLHGWRSLVAAVVAAALVACAKTEQASQADSTARNLTLAPAESTARLTDVAAPAAKAASRAPETKAARPVPKPAAPAAPVAPAALTLGAGTRVPLIAGDTISTRHAKAGDPFTASVSRNVTDAAGRVVIPAGAAVQGTIDVAQARQNSPGQLTLSVHSVTVHGIVYAVDGSVASEDTVEQGRGVTTCDAEKVGAGAAVGAIAGRLLGKDAKGTVIGGLVGAAGGAAVARATRSTDIVLPKGAALTMRLEKPLTIKR
jgi:Glycine zipper 2TM domain